ncbi:hypothetical protein BLNAU_5579 [Blattamonas nauphoetae]|uniref:Uncharacterized protein n=1 Tax=Blattamonas nauphoetae TaxID=2049346 RepID=A0ABQ9Y6Y6_9EUKA|nr:hypothetical protein BLNAU_5579 [Blattamonas nauphoetae]
MNTSFITGSSFIRLLIETDKNKEKAHHTLSTADSASNFAQEELDALEQLMQEFFPYTRPHTSNVSNHTKNRSMKSLPPPTPTKFVSQHCYPNTAKYKCKSE